MIDKSHSLLALQINAQQFNANQNTLEKRAMRRLSDWRERCGEIVRTWEFLLKCRLGISGYFS
ncbi:hypothetical protein BCAR13_710039 [Paraburkholderia caribensis]|nr:hypothetical protein BCAR13_710039 [Paraburkholderia caribensis]